MTLTPRKARALAAMLTKVDVEAVTTDPDACDAVIADVAAHLETISWDLGNRHQGATGRMAELRAAEALRPVEMLEAAVAHVRKQIAAARAAKVGG